MKIIQLTPGTGNFHCGTCLRDHALATELRKLGHEVLMVPLYLPLVTDEEEVVNRAPIFFGGINVYLQEKSPLFRKLPNGFKRFLNSESLLKLAARNHGMTAAKDLGELTLSMLRGEEGLQKSELENLVRWLKSQGPIDLLLLSNSLLVGMARQIKRELQIPIICTLQGEDSFLDALPELFRIEAWSILTECSRQIDGFVAVSHFYGKTMQQRLKCPEEKIHVVYNGIRLDAYTPRETLPDPPCLGYLARMCHGKGLEILVEAFIRIKKRNRIKGLKLRIAGSKTKADEPFIRTLSSRLAGQGLSKDVEFLPNLDLKSKQAFLKNISILSVPVVAQEAFGLYVLEALAAGVPVVQPYHSAFPELIEATGGGILYKPNEPAALASALEGLLLNPKEIGRLGQCGQRTVRQDFTAECMARNFLQVCEKIIQHPISHALRV